MNRYWVSWWTGNYEDEGCSNPLFQYWVTGYRDRNNNSGRNCCSICALIDAKNVEQIWKNIEKHFPDFEERFCDKVNKRYTPSGRFASFENRTKLI